MRTWQSQDSHDGQVILDPVVGGFEPMLVRRHEQKMRRILPLRKQGNPPSPPVLLPMRTWQSQDSHDGQVILDPVVGGFEPMLA